jgi:hypothetical protein
MEDAEFEYQQEREIFPFFKTSRAVSGPTHPPIGVPESFPGGKADGPFS